MVKQELDLVHDETKVYKMVGPVLLKQDLEEAKTNVNKRIEFINHELYSNFMKFLPSHTIPYLIIIAERKFKRRLRKKKPKLSEYEKR